MHAPTRYCIAPRDPHAHRFEVHCTVEAPDPAGQRFRLPTWIPGSYLIREFARHFVSVRAEALGSAVPIEKEAKDLWRAAPCAGPLTVVADVYAFDFSVRAAYLDGHRGYFNGASVFLCPEGRADAPSEVEIVAPEGPAFEAWRVATTLSSAGAAPWGFGAYRAASYEELIDHPVEMADFLVASFEAGGATHDVAITGKVSVDLDRSRRISRVSASGRSISSADDRVRGRRSIAIYSRSPRSVKAMAGSSTARAPAFAASATSCLRRAWRRSPTTIEGSWASRVTSTSIAGT